MFPADEPKLENPMACKFKTVLEIPTFIMKGWELAITQGKFEVELPDKRAATALRMNFYSARRTLMQSPEAMRKFLGIKDMEIVLKGGMLQNVMVIQPSSWVAPIKKALAESGQSEELSPEIEAALAESDARHLAISQGDASGGVDFSKLFEKVDKK